MKRSVKSLVLIPLFLCWTMALPAQIRLTGRSALAEDLRTLLADYPAAYSKFIGEELVRHPQSTDYRCLLAVKNTEQCFFTRYSARRTVLSWEAVVLSTEDYDQAVKQFRTLYQQLNPLPVKLSDGRSLKLQGDYAKPDPSLKFSSVILEPTASGEGLDRLRLEIQLTTDGPLGWQVKLLIYEKEKDDEERGAVREE